MLHRLASVRLVAAAALVTLASLLGGGVARAGHCGPCCTYKYVTTYECVTTYQTRLQPYTKVVTLYDHCGCPYQVTRTCYHEVQVPVTKHVPVCKKVLVCY